MLCLFCFLWWHTSVQTVASFVAPRARRASVGGLELWSISTSVWQQEETFKVSGWLISPHVITFCITIHWHESVSYKYIQGADEDVRIRNIFFYWNRDIIIIQLHTKSRVWAHWSSQVRREGITPYIIRHCSILLQLVCEKARDSLNLTPLGFVLLAGSQHQPQVAGEARPARQRVRGGAGRAEPPRPPRSPAPLADAHGLVGEDGDELVPGRARLNRQSPKSGEGPERSFQPGAVFGRRLEEGDVLTERLLHLRAAHGSRRLQVRFIPADHSRNSRGMFEFE